MLPRKLALKLCYGCLYCAKVCRIKILLIKYKQSTAIDHMGNIQILIPTVSNVLTFTYKLNIYIYKQNKTLYINSVSKTKLSLIRFWQSFHLLQNLFSLQVCQRNTAFLPKLWNEKTANENWYAFLCDPGYIKIYHLIVCHISTANIISLIVKIRPKSIYLQFVSSLGSLFLNIISTDLLRLWLISFHTSIYKVGGTNLVVNRAVNPSYLDLSHTHTRTHAQSKAVPVTDRGSL
jgi:hypothetical protein